MPDALKRGVKEFLGDGTPKWKQFASVARDLKAGAKTREDANNMMGIVLQGRGRGSGAAFRWRAVVWR